MYLVSESMRGWKQHRSVILPSLVTIFLCSFLLSASLTLLLAVFHASNHKSALFLVEAFIPVEMDKQSTDDLHASLLASHRVATVTLIDRDMAMEEFKKDFPPEMLELVEGNPLPASFRIGLAKNYHNAPDLLAFINELDRQGAFTDVQSSLEWVRWMEDWSFEVLFWPIVVSILLLGTLGLIIGNAVRLTLFSRRTLVENMKYAGGSWFFIQFPFVLEGFMQGFLGSLAGVSVWAAIAWSLAAPFTLISSLITGMGWLLLLVVFAVAAIGSYASFRSVRAFLSTAWQG